MPVTHAFVNPIADDPGFPGTKPSDWNAPHVINIVNADVDPAAAIDESKLNLNFATHAALTLGAPANGLTLVGQQLSLGLAASGVTGALSGADWDTFNNKQAALTFPLAANLGGTGIANAAGSTLTLGAATSITGGGTIALGGFTLTVPATLTVAGLGIANVFTVNQFIDGSADAIQLRVQGHSTQTNPFFLVESSAAAAYLKVAAGGQLESYIDSDTYYSAQFFNRTYNTSVPTFEYFSDNTGTFRFGTTAAKDFRFYTNNVANTRFSILADGSVLVSATNPVFAGDSPANPWTGIGAFGVVGSSDEVQVAVRAYATQTTPLQSWQDSSGNVLTSIQGAGNILTTKPIYGTIIQPGIATSYSNPGGTGDRTASITVTATAGLIGGTIANFVNGNTTENNFYFNTVALDGTKYLRFDFGAGNAKVITEAKYYQNSTDAQGTWKWQGSNDASSWTDIGSSFALGGAALTTITTLSANVTAYRYYQIVGVSGSSSDAAWAREFEFRVAQGTLHVRGVAGQQNNLQDWQDSSSNTLAAIDATGAFKTASLADSAAPNGSIYYSTDASKLVFKDSGGVVNNLY